MPQPRYRAVLRVPEAPGEPAKPVQTLHPSKKAALLWAVQIMQGRTNGRVEVYETTEAVVDVVEPQVLVGA